MHVLSFLSSLTFSLICLVIDKQSKGPLYKGPLNKEAL